MVETIINVDRFEGSHQSGLVFSLFEGLKSGESFQVISKLGLEDIKRQFIEAKVHNLKLEQKKTADGDPIVEIKKIADSKIGCCGMCGG